MESQSDSYERSELSKCLKTNYNSWFVKCVEANLNQTTAVYAYVKFYTFTVSPHQKYSPFSTVRGAFLSLLKLYKSIDASLYICETSEKGKKHIHGILGINGTSKFAKVRKHPTCKFHFSPYNPNFDWITYMMKDSPKSIYHHHRNKDGLHHFTNRYTTTPTFNKGLN